MRRGLLAALCALLAAGTAAAGPVAPEPPRRVVSLNVCTDQLALMVAAPGQIVSLSKLSRDPLYSAMAEAASAYPMNHGLAEEVFLLRPDLVLAGEYTTVATVQMLRRLGIRVEVFPLAGAMEDVGRGLRHMGHVLGREAAAEAAAARFEADLARLRAAPGPAVRAALYYPNSYTSGAGSLADAILEAAGVRNLAAEMGLAGLTHLPLEALVMARPEMIVTGQRERGAALAEGVQRHPALGALPERGPVADRDWVCGSPHVLRAVAQVMAAAGQLAPTGDLAAAPAAGAAAR